MLLLEEPVVMGIINITPDSFYEGSRMTDENKVLAAAGEMISAGASILDVGGQSTRPGSERVSPEEEMSRVIPFIKSIHRSFPDIIISVDTYYGNVAKAAVDAGASIINDISAGETDPSIVEVAAETGVPYVLMHKKGDPSNMQIDPQYEDVTVEVLDFFIRKIAMLRKAGVNDIIIDPGFGFGKTIRHNFTLLKDLRDLKITGCPLLAGLSRKSTIYRTLNTSPEDALNGTTILNTIALMNGADILRVHDVKEAKEACQLFQAYRKQ